MRGEFLEGDAQINNLKRNQDAPRTYSRSQMRQAPAEEYEYSEPAPRVRRHSREHLREATKPAFPYMLQVRLGILALFVIADVVAGALMGIMLPVVLLIYILVIAMAIILKNTPAYVSVIAAILLSIAGMITKNTDIVFAALTVYFATLLTFKEN